MKVFINILNLLFCCLGLCFSLVAQEHIGDSIRQQKFQKTLDSLTYQKENYPKNLLKIQWIMNLPNEPIAIPNGIRYERIWGRNSTIEIGFAFLAVSGKLHQYSIYGETRYYFRKQPKQYTFKGFFVRGGLVHQYTYSAFFSSTGGISGGQTTTGLMGGFGYQTVFWKKIAFEATIATSAGWYDTTVRINNARKLDAFRWNELALKIGYTF
jgi:hypothetical protein